MREMIKDLWNFLRARKKWWLLPVILVLLAVSALLMLTPSATLAPFVYTLF